MENIIYCVHTNCWYFFAETIKCTESKNSFFHILWIENVLASSMLFLTSPCPWPPLLKAVDPPVKTYHALDPPVRGPHELHQGGLVVPPLSLQAGVSGVRMDLVFSISLSPLFWWVLVTTELKGDLEVVGAKIVEVLHSTAHWIPAKKLLFLNYTEY